MKCIIWRYGESRDGSLQKQYFNGHGWGRRGSAQVMGEGEAREKSRKLKASMIKRI